VAVVVRCTLPTCQPSPSQLTAAFRWRLILTKESATKWKSPIWKGKEDEGKGNEEEGKRSSPLAKKNG